MKSYFSKTPPVKLVLLRDRTISIKQGHPWIFRDFLKEAPEAKPGTLGLLRAKDGAVVAQGLYDPACHLAFRACAVNPERFDDSLVEKRLSHAISLRRSLFTEDTTGFRLLNGEGDGLPGLVCDIYGDYAVWQLDGVGPSEFWRLSEFATYLSNQFNVRNSYRKHRSGEPASLSQVVCGEAPSGAIEFLENGLTFSADIVHGQKTGFFFDQRDNRERVRKVSANRRVLNLFGYTGGFSVYAGSGGASKITTVDIARPAVEAARTNWRLNGFEDSRHEACAADSFEFLEKAYLEKLYWDLVIVDPPSFAPGKQHVENARAGYTSVFTSAIKVTEGGGIFVASSCSSHISPELFLEICAESVSKAKRRATILGIYGQPEDHPFPLACQELRYLKFVMVRVD